MKPIRLLPILMLACLFLPAAAAAQGGTTYLVTVAPEAAIDGPGVAATLAAAYGGTLTGDQPAGAESFSMSLSEARARLLAADHRVASVTRAVPATADVPNEVVSWSSGVLYSYDGSGNITGIGNDTFAYDVVGRLVQAEVNSVSRTYAYDAFGNRLNCLQAGGTDCQYGIGVNRTANRNRLNLAYDEAGNIQGLAGHAYSYDELNMMTRDESLSPREFVYTADDERIATYAVGSSWHWTVRDPSGKVLREFASTDGPTPAALGTASWRWVRDNVWRDGLLLASQQPAGDSTTTYAYHLDHLGSPRRITDDNDQLVGFHDYFAFGPEVSGGLNEPSPAKMKYTGHERDSGLTGPLDTLDYMHARYHSPALGRFLSVDPNLDIKANKSTPQRWNRYSYVTNNPVNKFDPDGKDEYLFTWKATKDSVGHSAIAVQNRGADGRPTGTLTVRDLWPRGSVGKTQLAVPADYRVAIIPESSIAQYKNAMGRPADGIVRIAGDAKQDAAVTSALAAASKANPNYSVPGFVCSNFAAAGTAAAGFPATQTGQVTVWGGWGNAFDLAGARLVTPVALQNSLEASDDKRIDPIKPLNQADPNIDIKR